jgi:hypothetical protein
MLDEVGLACPVLDGEDFAMHSLSEERDPESQSVERLCAAILEQKFPSRYQDSLLALSFTLVEGIHDSKMVNNVDEHKAFFTAYRQVFQTGRIYSLPPDSLWQKFMIDAAQACYGRRFFPTASGYFGLGPAAMTGKDVFCKNMEIFTVLWEKRMFTAS